jgi:hydrogenase nickel incorporation protein HypA/HybF
MATTNGFAPGLRMHELAIAQSVFEHVSRRLGDGTYRRISAVGLRIGALTDLVPDALEFGFAATARGTPLESTRLEIEQVPITGRCRSCARSFPVERFVFACPGCGTREITVESGNEIEIAYLKVEDDDEAPPPAHVSTQRERAS